MNKQLLPYALMITGFIFIFGRGYRTFEFMDIIGSVLLIGGLLLFFHLATTNKPGKQRI